MDAGSGATQIVISFSPNGERVESELSSRSYRSYIRRRHAGPVSTGDKWSEFISRGCGTTQDVTLCVESIHGGDLIDAETEFVFEPVT